MTAAPTRSCAYNGPTTRAARWESFRARPGDIVISAPPKSGMTWTQALCAMLIFGRADLAVQPARLSPWFDAKFEPLAAMLTRLEAQPHRRYLKTHTPLDGLPYWPEVTYLAVYRHPLDAFFSMASLRLKEAGGSVHARIAMPGDVRGFMRACIDTPFSEGVGDQLSVGFVAHHLSGFWRHRDLPNIHLLHYADMARDLPGAVRRLADFLGIAAGETLVGEIAEAAKFENMKAHARQFAPESGVGWKNPADFFRGGQGGSWKDVLRADDLATYRGALEAAIPDAAIRAWLENGSA